MAWTYLRNTIGHYGINMKRFCDIHLLNYDEQGHWVGKCDDPKCYICPLVPLVHPNNCKCDAPWGYCRGCNRAVSTSKEDHIRLESGEIVCGQCAWCDDACLSNML